MPRPTATDGGTTPDRKPASRKAAAGSPKSGQGPAEFGDDPSDLDRLDLAMSHVNNFVPSLVAFAGGESFQSPAMAGVADELPEDVRAAFHESLVAASRYITHCFRVPGDDGSRSDRG